MLRNKRACLLLFFLCMVFYTLHGQTTPCEMPGFVSYACFEAPLKACVGSPIQVSRVACPQKPAGSGSSADPIYYYDWANNKSGGTAITTHIYTQAGTYTIHMWYENFCDSTNRTIEIVASPEPLFTLSSCEGRSITLDFMSDFVYDRFAINFNDGTSVDTVAGPSVNHVYASEGDYSVTVFGILNPASSCGQKTVAAHVITSLGALKPDIIDLRVLKQHSSQGAMRLRFNALKGVPYRIERRLGTGTYTPVDTIILAADALYAFEDLMLNTTQQYGYRVVAFDDCNERVSDEIYSVVITDININHLSNTIEWNAQVNAEHYDVYKSTEGASSMLFTSTPTTSTTDITVECQKEYCYQTRASLSTNTAGGTPHVSYSIDTCITAISTSVPTAISNVNSTMINNTVNVSWDDPTNVQEYYVMRIIDALPPVHAAALTITTYNEPVELSKNHCYYITYTDQCNNLSLSSPSTCPVLLAGTQTGNDITLSWNAYVGYNVANPTVNYIVQKFDDSNLLISEISVGTSTTFMEAVGSDPYLHYKIKVVHSSNSFLTPVFSNDVVFRFEAKLYAPDIFTPNGDGTNDLFLLKGKYITDFTLTIFNRWGEIVFNSHSMNEGWDGTMKGTYAPDGAYTYKVIATDTHNTELIQTGTLTLAR